MRKMVMMGMLAQFERSAEFWRELAASPDPLAEIVRGQCAHDSQPLAQSQNTRIKGSGEVSSAVQNDSRDDIASQSSGRRGLKREW